MAKPEMYLLKRANGFFYFRRRIPGKLRGLVDSGLFHHSLNTRNRSEAVGRYAAALARSEHEIAHACGKIEAAAREGRPQVHPGYRESRRLAARKAARRRAREFAQYSEPEVNRLLLNWFERKERQVETTYRDAFTLNGAEERLEFIQELSEIEGYLLGRQPPLNDMLISQEARAILDADDCEPPRNWLEDAGFRRFYGLLAEGLLRLNRMAVAFLKTGEMPRESPFQLPSNLPIATAAPAGITLEELIQRFENDPKRQHLREATRAEYKLIYRALREQLGASTGISAITRDDIRSVADTFLHLPSRATLTSDEPLHEIAAKAKAANLPMAHVKTYNKKVHGVSAIFRYATDEQLLAQNPAKALALPEPQGSGEGKSYDSGQLNTIFAGDLFTQFLDGGAKSHFEPNHPLRPCFFWSPLLALFHGARSGELLQLRTVNVFERDGIVALRIEGVVKNIHSFRIFPLHPELIRLGFLRYVEAIQKAGYERLFPDARIACDGKYSTWFQKPFGNYLRRIGVKAGREQCFHTFRHCFNEGLRRADVPEEVRRVICGWRNVSAEAHYGGQNIPRLFKHLEKLEYPGLDLRHLYPRGIAGGDLIPGSNIRASVRQPG
jgi:integrase